MKEIHLLWGDKSSSQQLQRLSEALHHMFINNIHCSAGGWEDVQHFYSGIFTTKYNENRKFVTAQLQHKIDLYMQPKDWCKKQK